MKYAVFILRRAQKDLSKVPRKQFERLRDAISELSDDPRPHGCRKLVGREGWRIRSGDYRVVYEIDDADKRVTVLHIGHRRDIYS